MPDETTAVQTASPLDDVTLTAIEGVPEVGTRCLLVPGATTDSGGGVFFQWPDDGSPIEVTVREARAGMDNYRVRGPGRHGESTQWVAPRFLRQMREPEWAPGMKFRVTSTAGSHGFPIGTIVTALREPSHSEARNRADYFHATTLDLPTYEEGSLQRIGTTAWVHATPDSQGFVNVERYVPEPEPEPEPTLDLQGGPIPVGTRFRITGPGDGHGFEVDTIVQAAVRRTPGQEAYTQTTDQYRQVFCTTLDLDPTVPRNWQVGQSAYVTIWSTRAGYMAVCGELVDVPAPSSGQEEIEPIDIEAYLSTLTEGTDEYDRVKAAAERLTEAKAAVVSEQQERAQWLERLIERSRVVADEQEWCGVYDEGMRALGLPDRSSWNGHNETVTVSTNIEVEVSFDSDDFEDWFRSKYDGVDFRSVDSDSMTFTVNVDAETEVEVSHGDCGCGEVDWSDHIPNWIRDHGFDWSTNETECSND